jgi:hypothetical protein
MAKRCYLRRIEVRVPRRDFADGAWAALERLGYELKPANEMTGVPDARMVAGGRLSGLSADATQPVILFRGWHGRDRNDPRVMGIVRPPARLLDLYGLLQGALETHPRAVPRIPTALSARSHRGGAYIPGAIISLSEGGCRLRSAESLSGDERLNLQFALPGIGLVYTWAKPLYREGRETGLAFERLPEKFRSAISEFVTQSLTPPG